MILPDSFFVGFHIRLHFYIPNCINLVIKPCFSLSIIYLKENFFERDVIYNK